MAATGLSVERLHEYLQQLPPAARALLIEKLEGAGQSGEPIPGGEVLLQELRSVLRRSGEPAARGDTVDRQFFRPVEFFLTDDDPTHKLQGRIARASLGPLWTWICRDLVPREANDYCTEMGRALAATDSATCERLTEAFQNLVIADIRSMLEAVQADHKARRRMVGQIGTPNGLEDVGNLATILSGRAAFALIASRLPGHIRNLADGQIEGVKGLLDTSIGAQGDLLPHALTLVMSRMAAPWQLIRLAVKAAESDDAGRIAATPYAPAVTITLAEIDRMVLELQADLRRGPGPVVNALIKSIHDAIRGVRTELAFTVDSSYGRRIAAIRAEVADVLNSEIETMPGRVRRLLRPNPASEAVPNAILKPGEVTETEALIEFVGVCRNHAGELAISEMTLRTQNEVQQYLDTSTQVLLDALRGAGVVNRSFRQSQVDAAVRFCAKIFGSEYAALLIKAAEVAANGDRKTAVKV
jgi:hypothetical protein